MVDKVVFNNFPQRTGTNVQVNKSCGQQFLQGEVISIDWDMKRSGEPGIREVFVHGDFAPEWVKENKGSILGVAFQNTTVDGSRVIAYLNLKLAVGVHVNPKLPICIGFENAKSSTNLPIDFDFTRPDKDYNIDGTLSLTAKITHRNFQAILKSLNAPLHSTFIRAFTGLSPSFAMSHTIESKNLAYPILQHSLFFLPGVFGSVIRVKVNVKGKEKVKEAFPEAGNDWSSDNQQLLACDRNGDPKWEAVPTELKILENVVFDVVKRIYTISDIMSQLEKLEASYPQVFLDDPRKSSSSSLKRIKLIPTAYDWRLDISKSYKYIAGVIKATHKNLAESGDTKENLGYPFLNKKISLAGHSTGGVIMRGIVSLDNPLKNTKKKLDLVENAFFIDVPFRGAPKAEYVFLTGKMDDTGNMNLVANPETLRQMACDMPIVYFLSPNVPEKTWNPVLRRKRVEEAIENGCYDPTREKLFEWDKYPDLGPLRFNSELADRAERYYKECVVNNSLVKTKAYIFYSLYVDSKDNEGTTIIKIEPDKDWMFDIGLDKAKEIETQLSNGGFKLYDFDSPERREKLFAVLGVKRKDQLVALADPRVVKVTDNRWSISFFLPTGIITWGRSYILVEKQKNASLRVYNSKVKTKRNNNGDGTVPYKSQVPDDIFQSWSKGGWRDKEKIEIEGNLDHVAAPNSSKVWKKIFEELFKANLDESV